MKITNKLNLPDEIVAALKTQWYSGNPKKVSATRLIDAPRIFYLSVRHYDKIEEDVSERVWTLFGSAIHSVLQKTELDNHLKEERLSFTKNGITVSGAFDVYGNQTITDYKVTSVWNVIYGSSNDKWEKQLNVYAYMLIKNGFNPQKAQIIAILRDWSASKAKTTADYPKSPIYIHKVKLWSFDRLDAYIDVRTKLFAEAEKKADANLPFCSDDERWTTQTKYAVMKKGRKSAVKLFDEPEPAEKLIMDNINKGYYLEIRGGEARRCEEYCSVRDFCNQYDRKEVKC